MKTMDVVAAILLVVGGLNWGLVGIFGFDLVAGLFGSATGATRAIYLLVGLAAIYQAATLPAIQRRWNVQPSLTA